MSFRIANIHEYDQFIAIDLGSYRVRASLYGLNDGHLVHEGSASVRQNRKNFLDGTITDMQWVAITIEKAIHEVCKNSHEIPEDIILAFSPAVCIYDTVTTQYIRTQNEETLSMQEIDTMIEKIEQTSLFHAKEKAKIQYGLIHDDIRLISSTLTEIFVDGKHVTNPIGFTGTQVRITVLNVFCLASEFNIIRSIISSLKKRTISLVPMPLIFPKITEIGEQLYDDTIYIDIGYMHTTFIFEKKSSVESFETFPFGSKMYTEMLSGAFPKTSYIEIENIITRVKPSSIEKETRESLAREYLSYVIDILLSLLERNKHSPQHKNIFVSGGIFSSEWIENMFFEILNSYSHYEGKHLHLANTQNTPRESKEYLITEWLSLLAQELLFRKKDPLIRILRYALYHYE